MEQTQRPVSQPSPPGSYSPGVLGETSHRLSQAAVFCHGHIWAEQGFGAGHGMLLGLALQQVPARGRERTFGGVGKGGMEWRGWGPGGGFRHLLGVRLVKV